MSFCSTCVQGESSRDQNTITCKRHTDVHQNRRNETRHRAHKKLAKPSGELAPQRKGEGHITGTVNIPGGTRRQQNLQVRKKKAFESLGEATKIGAHMPISEDAAILIVRSESHTAGSHSPHRERKTVTSAKVHDITKNCHIVNSIIAKNERNPISIFKP